MKNKWLGLLAALCLLVTCLCSVTALAISPVEGKFETGDANHDGSVDMKDALLIRRFIAHLEDSIDEVAADTNGDGAVDMKDLLLLRQFIAHWDVTLYHGDTSDVVSDTSEVSAVSDASEVSDASDTSDTSDGSREPYIYGDDGEPYINFIDDPNCSLGVWWWNTGDGNNATLRDKYLKFLAANGTTQIYYYCAYDIQKANGRMTTYTFVKAAAELGMTVAPIIDDYYMAGDKSYARSELAKFKAGYEAYQTSYPDAPLAGFHCDIEPHQLNEDQGQTFDSLRPEQLQGYADYFLAELQPLRAAGIPIEVDLNCQWNTKGGADVTYGGYKGIYNVIAHYVDSMCLMAYRDTAEDILALGDVAYAAAMDAGTRLVFAVESGAYACNQPYEEFAQEDKEYMYEEFAKVYAALKDDHPAGGYGLAVHQHRTWYDLKKRA
ncbi:MAG: dockerin type I repeat-containing protein [Clostridia bacterium]|nr:dockerin type I repeat-containing protein [Clostridia bacterium]